MAEMATFVPTLPVIHYNPHVDHYAKESAHCAHSLVCKGGYLVDSSRFTSLLQNGRIGRFATYLLQLPTYLHTYLPTYRPFMLRNVPPSPWARSLISTLKYSVTK
jgi:hypothetical protein